MKQELVVSATHRENVFSLAAGLLFLISDQIIDSCNLVVGTLGGAQILSSYVVGCATFTDIR